MQARQARGADSIGRRRTEPVTGHCAAAPQIDAHGNGEDGE